MIIKEVSARKILDSRREPTIEVSVNNCKASSPSGTSAGKYETRSFHKSLSWNIKALNNFKSLIGLEINSFADLNLVEDLIEQTFKLSDAKKFGANALFALESAILKALSKSQHKELWQVINPGAKRMPIPLGNAVGGGLHTKNKSEPTFQEFLLIPNKKTIRENVKIMNLVYKKIGKIIKARSKGQEGEWQTSLHEEQILHLLSKFKNIRVGLDIAASAFYKDNYYNYNTRKSLSRSAQISHINSLIEKFNLFYIEDPLDEEDFKGFARVRKSSKHLVVGDDLTASHLQRIKEAIKNKSINCVIVKPNQNGSLLEIYELVRFCKRHKIKIAMSHRAGETLDNALADYAFAFQADFIKCGISTPYREIKLKRLIEIEKSLK